MWYPPSVGRRAILEYRCLVGVLGAWLLAGCGASAPEPAAVYAGDDARLLFPGVLGMTAHGEVAGHPVRVPVTGADPGSAVTLLASDRDGPGRTCRWWSCVDLNGQVEVIGRATADKHGVAWFRHDLPLAAAGHTLYLQAIGVGKGFPGTSPVVTVSPAPNTIPAAPVVTLAPPDVAGCELVPVLGYPAFDADGDPVTPAAHWTRDGVPEGTADHVPAGVTHPGEVWHLTVAVTDGLEWSPAADAEVTIPDRPPTAVPAISPLAPASGDVATCAWTFADPDGDAEGPSTVRWTLDGIEVATGSTWTVAGDPGQEIACEVTPHDGIEAGAPATARTRVASNVLVLIVDDMGIDKSDLYGIDPETPPTPNIDALAASGVVFREAWATPLCSSSRAALVTGRYGYRTGIGAGIDPESQFALSRDERTIAGALNEAGGGRFATSYVGKWHIGTVADSYATHPLVFGFGWHSGAMIGMGEAGYSIDGRENTYDSWERFENGAVARTNVWPDTSHVDDAIARATAMPEPWAMIVGFAVGHRPYHDPPVDLYGGPPLGDDLWTQQYHAMIESLDTEIGRLIAGIPPDLLARTTVVVLGDNGTKGYVVSPLWDPEKQKRTLYQGGVHVPLIVTGPLVKAPGREVDALVSIVDLFPTIADALGAPVPTDRALDGTSLVPYLQNEDQAPLRETVYAELFEPPGFGPYDYHDQAIRDARWKLIRFTNHDELYDMQGLEVEGEDLLADGVLTLEEQAAYDGLAAQLPAP